MNQRISKVSTARNWLFVFIALDCFLVGLSLYAAYFGNFTRFSFPVYFLFFLFLCGTFAFAYEYYSLHTESRKKSYREDYLGQQIRFAVIVHVFDPAESGNAINFASQKPLREWFYSRFGVPKQYSDELALIISLAQGYHGHSLTFKEDFTRFMEDHPINDAYYSGFAYTNGNYPMVFNSRGLGKSDREGFCVMFIAETSYNFYEDFMKEKIIRLVHNQGQSVDSLVKLFESNSKNKLSCSVELQKLDL